MNNKKLIDNLIQEINSVEKEIKIMEVCGTHTNMISKLGIRSILKPNIKLLSGPGCPVCVTDELFIDDSISLLDHASILTFGDLIKVKGSSTTLLEAKSKGKDVRILHSPLDVIEIAKKEPKKDFVFLGVGFETTAPVIALTIKKASDYKLNNLSFLTSIKLMKPILKYIFNMHNEIDGLICPGHVASVKGANYFSFLTDYKIPAAVCGFEALDIIKGINFLVKEISSDTYGFENLYKRCVKDEGNKVAVEVISEVFKVSDVFWRGIGMVNDSALVINNKYSKFDAVNKYNIKTRMKNKVTCICGDILLGKKSPQECKLFANKCNPNNPNGPCMVSTEGSCRNAYRYRGELI